VGFGRCKPTLHAKVKYFDEGSTYRLREFLGIGGGPGGYGEMAQNDFLNLIRNRLANYLGGQN